MVRTSERIQPKKIQESIITALLAANLKSVPHNVRLLSTFMLEKNYVFARLQKILARANIYFETDFFEEAHLSAKMIFRAILNSSPATANVVILQNRKLRDTAPLVETLLNSAVCQQYGPVLTHKLLQIESLEDQITQMSEEIVRKTRTLKKQSPPIFREETSTLVEPSPRFTTKIISVG